jgi:hypothetical protein
VTLILMVISTPRLVSVSEAKRHGSAPRFSHRAVSRQMAVFETGQQPCTDAYFPALSGFHRVNICFKLIEAAPEGRERFVSSLRAFLVELASGTGRWKLPRSGSVVGPSALLEAFPGGRLRVQKLVELVNQNASLMEIAEIFLDLDALQDCSRLLGGMRKKAGKNGEYGIVTSGLSRASPI